MSPLELNQTCGICQKFSTINTYREDTHVSHGSSCSCGFALLCKTRPHNIYSTQPTTTMWSGPTQEQVLLARMAAASRMEDPLKNWQRPHKEDCPICLLPFPLDPQLSVCWNCCGKTICSGCMYSQCEANLPNMSKMKLCPFCRFDGTNASILKMEMKRANAGNHMAMFCLAECYFEGEMGLQQDTAKGIKWYHRAMEAGNGEAASCLGSYFWDDGENEKALEFYQTAAELGHILAFFNVGNLLINKGDIDGAMINYRKAAICGDSHPDVFYELRNGYRYGWITKEEYAFTLRANQAACNEMKSEAREKAEKFNTRR